MPQIRENEQITSKNWLFFGRFEFYETLSMPDGAILGQAPSVGQYSLLASARTGQKIIRQDLQYWSTVTPAPPTLPTPSAVVTFPMKPLTRVVLFAISLCVLTLQAQATPGYLEWQPAQLTNGQSSLKTRFWAKPGYQVSPQVGNKQVRLISLPYQHFAICADYVTSEAVSGTPAFIAPPEKSGKQDHYYPLITLEPDTILEVLRPNACTVDGEVYPYHSLNFLHSEKPFLAVELEGKPRGHRRQKDTGGGGIPLPTRSSPGTVLSDSSGGGYVLDDDDQQHKPPPWLPLQTSNPYSLMVLPTLKLPEELKGFLPGTGLYYDLLEQLGYGEDINIVLRIDGHDPASIPVHRSEQAELAEHMTSAQALMNWLTPRLNGREELVSWLLDIQTCFGADDDYTGPEKAFLEAVAKQLAIVLEQGDSEFSLEFEQEWLTSQTLGKLMSDAGPDTSIVYDSDEVNKLLHQGMCLG